MLKKVTIATKYIVLATLFLLISVSTVHAQETTTTKDKQCLIGVSCTFILPKQTTFVSFDSSSDTSATYDLRFASVSQYTIRKSDGTTMQPTFSEGRYRIPNFPVSVGTTFTITQPSDHDLYVSFWMKNAKRPKVQVTYRYIPTVKTAATTGTQTTVVKAAVTPAPIAATEEQALPATGSEFNEESIYTYLKFIGLIIGALALTVVGIHLKNYGQNTKVIWSK